jgi:site-specific DNA-methyltransferase (adenine-specific)
MIINGDCLEHLFTIKSGSVDLILIDPPYLISKSSNFKCVSESTPKDMVSKYNISIDFGDWDKGSLDWNILFSEYSRILKKGGTLIIFYDVWKANELKEVAELNKFKQPRVCTWYKSNPVPINSKINYLSNSAEYFFTFIKGSNPTFNSKYDNGVYNYPICHGKERHEHPTQKPLRLIMDLIEKHSNPGDVVLDTFAGTFTTHNACDNLNRECISIEKDEKYFDIGKLRINKNRIEINLNNPNNQLVIY